MNNRESKFIRALIAFAVATNGFLFAFAPIATEAATQNNYRWRNDDGAESTATYAAAQNTTFSVPQNTPKRLRFGVNATAAEQALTRVAAQTYEEYTLDDFLTAGVIDTVNGFAYFADEGAPGDIVKVNLSTRRAVDQIELPAGEQSIASAVIDRVAGFAYFATNTIPAKVIKVDINPTHTFARIGSITLNSGENGARTMTLDASGLTHYAYVGTDTIPGRVVKISLTTFSRIGAITLNSGEDELRAAVTDTVSGKAYFGTTGAPAIVVRVDLGTFTRDAALTLNLGESVIQSSTIDTTNGFAYFGGLGGFTAYVTKIRLSNFTREGVINLGGDLHTTAAAIDVSGGHAFFATQANGLAAVNLFKVNLSTFTNSATATLTSDQVHVPVLLSDGANSALYVGVQADAGVDEMLKVTTTSFTVASTTVFNQSAPSRFNAALIDTGNGFAYFGSDSDNGNVLKIRLSDMSEVARLNLGTGTDSPSAAVLDTSTNMAYFAIYSSPAKVVKVNLSTFTVVSTLNLSDDFAQSAAIDVVGGYIYVGLDLDPSDGKIIKVRLSDFTEFASLTLNAGEETPGTAVIDTSAGFVYFAVADDTPASTIVKIQLSNFSRVGTLALNSGEDYTYASAIDTSGATHFAYFGTFTSPAKVVKVNLNSFMRVGAVTFGSGEEYANSLVIDTTNGGLYTALDTTPGIITKIDLATFAQASSLTLNTGEDEPSASVIDVSTGLAYFGTSAGFDEEIVKVSISGGREYRLEYGTKVTTCAAIASWTQVGSSGGAQQWVMSNSSNITNAAVSTDQADLTNGNTTFFPGRLMDTSSETPTIAMGNSAQFTEIEYSLKPKPGATLGNYCFRLSDAGTVLGSYTSYGEATVTSGTASSDRTLANSILMSRLKQGVSSEVSINFTLQNELSGTLTVTFPGAFTVTSAPNDPGSSDCLTSFGNTSTTVFATKTNCSGDIVLGGFTVTNPNTPGVYEITWINDDPGGGSVYIVDDDQVTVSATVSPSVTFNVGSQAAATACAGSFAGGGGTVALGTLTTGAVTSSDASSVPHICTRVSTNATQGVVVTVKNLNGTSGLKSISVPADTIPSSSATLVAGTEGYGLCAGSAAADSDKDWTTPAGAHPASSSPFNGSCTSSAHAVGGLTTSPQTVWSISSSSQNAFVRLYVKAAIGPTTEAHNDYTDTLTFVATGTF